MAYCVFTNCLSILGSGITPYTSLDSRSGCALTTSVGQIAFFGSSDNSGPLGMVFQHVCGNGVCRVDITSTRYGISGNDLSLNVDSTNPFSTGGVLIKYGGGVAMGTGQPCGALDVYRQGSGGPNTGDNLIVRGGNSATLFGSNQIRFGYAGGIGYSHAIKSRHQSGSPGNNALDFFIWTTADAAETTGTKLVMTLDGTGNVGMGTCSPNIVGFTGTMLTLNGTGNYQGLEIGTSGTTRMTVVSDGLNGYVSTRQAGMCLIFEAGAASEKMRITSGGNVGIGTSAPIGLLEVRGASCLISNHGLLQVNSSTSVGIDLGGSLSFGGVYQSTAITEWAQISGRKETAISGEYGAYLDFATRPHLGLNTSRIRISSTGNVGIGTTSPTTGKLEVSGSILTSGGLVAALANSSALSFESTFSRLIAFGTDASTNGCFRLISSRSDGSNQLTWLAGNASGNVGINCLTPTYKLHVNGTFYAAGSSCEYKTQICEYNTDSCMFMKLTPVTYQYKDEWCHLGKELKSETQIGLIAEDVAEVYPELAILVNEDDQKIVRNVDYEKLSIVLLSEVQKLRKELDELKTK